MWLFTSKNSCVIRTLRCFISTRRNFAISRNGLLNGPPMDVLNAIRKICSESRGVSVTTTFQIVVFRLSIRCLWQSAAPTSFIIFANVCDQSIMLNAFGNRKSRKTGAGSLSRQYLDAHYLEQNIQRVGELNTPPPNSLNISAGANYRVVEFCFFTHRSILRAFSVAQFLIMRSRVSGEH